MSQAVVDMLRGISGAAASMYDGAVDEDGEPVATSDQPSATNIVNSQYGEPQMYFGGKALSPGYYAGPADGVFKYGTGPYAEQTQSYLDSVGLTFDQFVQQADWKEGDRPWDDQGSDATTDWPEDMQTYYLSQFNKGLSGQEAMDKTKEAYPDYGK